MKTLRDLIDSLPRGLDTPVLGEPAKTVDGALILDGADVFIVTPDGVEPGRAWHQMVSPIACVSDSPDEDDIIPVSECYSTKESAEHAAKERQ